MCACMYGCMRACVRACMLVCMDVCVHVYVHVCLYVWMYACMCTCMFYIMVALGQVDAWKRFTLHPLADLFTPTPSRLACDTFSYAAITALRLFVHISTTVCSKVLVQI